MAEGWEDFITDQVNDLLLRDEAITLPGSWYVACFEAGSEVGTGVWTNYAREAVVRNTTNFAASSAGDAANATIFDFGTATVTGGPQDVDEIRLYDASTVGNGCWRALLNTPKSINDGDPVTIPIGDLDFSFAQT